MSRFKSAARTTLLALMILFVFPFAPLLTTMTSALTSDQKKALDRGVYYFNTEIDACQTVVLDENSLTGRDNEEKIVNFLFDKLVAELKKTSANETSGANVAALAAAQAAGIVGNLIQESNLNPSSVSGPAHGIAQWEGGRWPALQKFVSDYNAAHPTLEQKVWTDLDMQLGFLWSEMPGQFAFGQLSELQRIIPAATAKTSALQAVLLSTTPTIAAQAFEYTFERAGDPRMERRISLANGVYARHGSRLAGTTIVLTPITGQDGSCLNIANCPADGNGYCFPIAPGTQRHYTGLPCPAAGEIPGYGARGITGVYIDEYGNRAQIRSCHHEPLSPAFDLYYGPNNSNGTPIGAGGQPIYALTKGTITRIKKDYCNPSSCSASGKLCNSIDLKSSLDNYFVWHGHVLARPDLTVGKEVKAGEPIGQVAPENYGPKCWGGAPHLHIDRGCVGPGNNYRNGGRTNCRDPKLMDIMANLWKGLPR